MPRKFAIEYIDGLLAEARVANLAQLSSVICCSARFRATAPDCGLPPFALVFVETLNWLSMAIRSGVWTYYEATPQARQDALAAALRQAASAELASRYEQGMRDWRDETRIAAVDRWMKTNEDATDEWLRALLRRSREGLLELAAE